MFGAVLQPSCVDGVCSVNPCAEHRFCSILTSVRELTFVLFPQPGLPWCFMWFLCGLMCCHNMVICRFRVVLCDSMWFYVVFRGFYVVLCASVWFLWFSCCCMCFLCGFMWFHVVSMWLYVKLDSRILGSCSVGFSLVQSWSLAVWMGCVQHIPAPISVQAPS